MLAPPPLTLGLRMRDEAPLGVLGAPRYADAAHGEKLFTAIAERIAEAIEALAERALPSQAH